MSATAAAPPIAVPARESVMARAGGENFPVAGRFLPRVERSRLLAIYGFARLADDLGDEAPGDRSALLAEGAPLVRNLAIRPRIAVAAFIAGGRAALDALERAGYDVLGRRPRPSRRAFALELGRAVGGR